MEIDTYQMEEFLRIQMQPTGQTPKAQSTVTAPNTFDSILSEAIAAQDNAKQNALAGIVPHSAGQSEMISQMLINGPIADGDAHSDMQLLQTTFDNASGTLDLWDSYAQKLSSSNNGDLREAYSLLEHIGTQVEQLKSNASNLRTPNFGLNSFINEMDIIATTEKIKFYRGDYV